MFKKKIKFSKPLSRCPFCGGKAEITKEDEEYSFGRLITRYKIRCQKCGMEKEEVQPLKINNRGEIEYQSAYQKLIDYWENRVSEEDIIRELKDNIEFLEIQYKREQECVKKMIWERDHFTSLVVPQSAYVENGVLKKRFRCEKCGHSITDEKFCPSCGRELIYDD